MPRALHMQATSHTPTSTPIATARLASRGFSLLELVLVIVIVATISGIALPRMSSSTNNSRADQAIDRIEATLNKAREMARSRSTSVSVRFSTGNERMKIEIGGSTVEKVLLELSPYYTDLTTASFGTDKYIIYNGLGMQDTGGTVSIAVGSAKRTLTVADPPANDSSSRVVSLTRSTQLDAVNLSLVVTGGTGVNLGN